MNPVTRVRGGLPLYLPLAGVGFAIFVVDLLTPLGVAVWILYFVPVGLTVFGRDSNAPLIAAAVSTLLMAFTAVTDEHGMIETWVAYFNRVIGVIVVWSIAVLARSFIISRDRVEAEDWVRNTYTGLLEHLQGDPSVGEIGDRALALLSTTVEAPVGALYAHDGAGLTLVASRGLRPGVDLPERFQPGEGLVGEAARGRRTAILTELREDFFALRSGLAEGRASHLAVCPLRADGVVHGVLELALLRAPEPHTVELLNRAADGLAVAIRTAFYRERVGALLEETQRQAEELQGQQEELKTTNEELEEQRRNLVDSQARLEEQQSELEASNAQLELHTRDLEQQKQALARAKQEAERASRYKTEFLANMSHELRTPLNSSLILAKLLAENKDGRLSSEQVRYAETIHSSGNSLLALINDILDLSRIEAGVVEVTPEAISPRDLIEGLRRVFQPLMAEKGLALSAELAPGVPATLHTDGQRLQQILTNLLSNAMKFTERGEVSLRVVPAGPDTVSFMVRDTGVGIPAEQREIIFEAFRQADGSIHRRHGGTGLGLSISRELARLLGGDIRVDSEPGAGSVFTLTIQTQLNVEQTRAAATARRASAPEAVAGAAPAERSPARPVPAAAAVPDDRDNRRHPGRLILVVEDDLVFARILYDLAHDLDFDCVIATSNDEGMALARDLAPNAILLDIGLPDGSGLTLLDRVKRNPDTRHIPVHVVSVSDYTHTALELGAVGYALKPVQREELVKALRKLEDRLDQGIRRVLVVEDDHQLREDIGRLLQTDGVTIHGAGTAREALDQLAAQSFDCVVLDLTLPDASGYEVLETMSASEQYSFPPVIVYTGLPLSAADEERLRRYSRSVIVKGAGSPERLLDEVTLFLHQVESRLPPESQRLLRAARERDVFFEGRTILVVEDDVRNVFALTSVFEPRGARVIIARNGREALDQLDGMRPDLVLMDIMMPEMDGLTAMREIRKRPELKALPIVALTAKAMRDDYEQCIAAGANDYLAKPLDVDKLVSLCRVWISR